MQFTNSQLVNHVNISPNRNSPRNDKIKKITIHHMAGKLSVEQCGKIFEKPERKASSNYGVDNDARYGMYCEEKDRSWCSGSRSNDHQAITIEVANDGGAPNWHVSDKAIEATIVLCVDVCKRNGIKELKYTGDVSGNLTTHDMFEATLCPGPYLKSRLPYIADEVNKRLKNGYVPSKPTNTDIKVDGYWGVETTKALQKAFGSVVDGYLSNQVSNKVTRKIETKTIRFGVGGSLVIKKLQALIGVRVDGYLGEQTIRALQKYLGTPIDGVLSSPSMVVKELQRRLNAGTLVR